MAKPPKGNPKPTKGNDDNAIAPSSTVPVADNAGATSSTTLAMLSALNAVTDRLDSNMSQGLNNMSQGLDNMSQDIQDSVRDCTRESMAFNAESYERITSFEERHQQESQSPQQARVTPSTQAEHWDNETPDDCHFTDDKEENQYDHRPTSRNPTKQPPFIVQRYPLTSGKVKIDKFHKSLLAIPAATSDNLVNVQMTWDSVISAINSAADAFNILPLYKDLTCDFEVRAQVLPVAKDHYLLIAENNLHFFGNVLYTMILGNQLITSKTPLLYTQRTIHANKSCGFQMLKHIVFGVSPHLGGENRDLVALIESFVPEDNEHLSMYFSRAMRLLNEAKVARLSPHQTNHLTFKWLSGIQRDSKFAPHVSQYVKHYAITLEVSIAIDHSFLPSPKFTQMWLIVELPR